MAAGSLQTALADSTGRLLLMRRDATLHGGAEFSV
jgi:hypothetical protein